MSASEQNEALTTAVAQVNKYAAAMAQCEWEEWTELQERWFLEHPGQGGPVPLFTSPGMKESYLERRTKYLAATVLVKCARYAMYDVSLAQSREDAS